MSTALHDDADLPRMTRAEFYAWVAQQPRGRYERQDGYVVAMSPERLGHALIKMRVWQALDSALAGSACRAIPDGVGVKIEDRSDYEPDVMVTCEMLDLEAVTVAQPIIMVEVTSRSTRSIDAGSKLADYFWMPSVQHYLMVRSWKREVIHHRRDGDRIETRITTTGPLTLDPPGIAVAIEDFYAGLDL